MLRKKSCWQKNKFGIEEERFVDNEIEFETAIDSLVNNNELELCGSDSSKTYFMNTHRNNIILVPQTQESESENINNENPAHLSNDTPILDQTSQIDSPQTKLLMVQLWR